MSKFKIDNEQIDSTVDTLKTLLTKCKELYEKEVPVSEVDKGQTHEELISVCENIKTTCFYFGQLIHNTIEFLGDSSEMFAQSEKKSADAISTTTSTTASLATLAATVTEPKTTIGHAPTPTAWGGKVIKETISNIPEDAKSAASVMEWLNGKWIDEQLSGLPLSVREHIKKALEEAGNGFFGENFGDAYDITQKILDGNYLGALKDATGVFYKKEGFFEGLGPKFVINSAFGMAEEYVQYAKNPNLENLLSIGWSGTVGSVFETCGDAAWDVAKFIPGVSDWYGEHGATDMGSAFNVAYTETVRAVFGDDMADYCGSYYADNGGLFGGLVNGFKEIKRAVDDSCEKHGGIMGVWLNGWNSMFS